MEHPSDDASRGAVGTSSAIGPAEPAEPAAPPPAHRPHRLHIDNRIWTGSQRRAALWIEILHGWGLEPLAMLGCAVAQDFAGDQFGLLNPPREDLETLFGVTTFTLGLYGDVRELVERQTVQGNVVLLALDGYYLSDAPALYRVAHGSVTVGIDSLDRSRGIASYYRRGVRYELRGSDYEGAFGAAEQEGFDEALLREAECVSRVAPPTAAQALPGQAAALLSRHLARRPVRSPIEAFGAVFDAALDRRLIEDIGYRHAFVYATLHQLGGNFELLGALLEWMARHQLKPPREALLACRTLASEALVFEMRLLRANSRGRADRCLDVLGKLQRAYARLIEALLARFGTA
ncbi:DUF1839 family protein [Chitinasiproducens palmae]|uniref:Uncharacterized protein n=1 Tax=Chitinasiproducens palmae TaxID=1770053 RepID=A0A1H2PTU6_9BURK|nr:DUF1839 family protein [Chitinasiproducens palmae]SDV50551.1 protein of unknown function [Chitinasiproducens palmae]